MATSPTTTTIITSTPPTQDSAPIVIFFTHYLPAVYSILSRIAVSFIQVFTWIIRTSTAPILFPIPILAYVFAPVTVLAEIFFEIFIATPYYVVVYLLDLFYPVYVFCGIACIVGASIGLAARVVMLYFVDTIVESAKPVEAVESREKDSYHGD
ncbi:hypothetical protein K435DRAFT_861443 [Dendrothele bispora CBS 962.96]|uniref:Uncharacterized protein n=1 Tax=Dendrothele bispora (strain CBS 962.96) TaxID=1314807 RepID=A0A4S8LVD4_DENBC|nr:hypothetical protein K435DRAFT_861443 [Dendrothele bispora CBS 962.96]